MRQSLKRIILVKESSALPSRRRAQWRWACEDTGHSVVPEKAEAAN